MQAIYALYAVALITALGIVFRVWLAFPSWMHWDENYYVNIAQNYADRGELTPYMWRLGDTNIIAGSGSGYGIVLLAEWMRLVGFSLFWGRVLMILLSLLAGVVVYKTANIWWHSRVAGFAAFCFSVVSTSSLYTLILKMDSMGILLYSLALLLHIYSVRLNNKWLHLGLGLAAVATIEFHVLGLLYLLAFAFYYVVCQLKRILNQRRLVVDVSALYFGIGALFAGIVYAVIHILPNPDAYFIISRHCFECNEGLLVTESKRLIRSMVFRPQELVTFLLVIASVLARRKRQDWHYLVIVMGWLVAQALVGPPAYPHYTNHMWPLLALGVGGLVAWGFNHTMRERRVALAIGVAVAFLTANIGMHVLGIYPDTLSHKLYPSEAIEYVKQTTPKDTVVMGSVSSSYPLRDYRSFLSYRDGTIYGTMLRKESMLDLWRRIQPQVILLDEKTVAQDSDLTRYMAERRFVHVMPDLWIAEDLQVNRGP
jgi:hypothetical protein